MYWAAWGSKQLFVFSPKPLLLHDFHLDISSSYTVCRRNPLPDSVIHVESIRLPSDLPRVCSKAMAKGRRQFYMAGLWQSRGCLCPLNSHEGQGMKNHWGSSDGSQFLWTSSAAEVPNFSDVCTKMAQFFFLISNQRGIWWVLLLPHSRFTCFMTESIWLCIWKGCYYLWFSGWRVSWACAPYKWKPLKWHLCASLLNIKGVQQRHLFHSTRVLLSQKGSQNQFWWFHGYMMS